MDKQVYVVTRSHNGVTRTVGVADDVYTGIFMARADICQLSKSFGKARAIWSNRSSGFNQYYDVSFNNGKSFVYRVDSEDLSNFDGIRGRMTREEEEKYVEHIAKKRISV